MKDEPCAHCWHYVGGWTNGLGSAGEDNDKCCFCGATRKRTWVGKHDPKHGPHINDRIKVYED